MTAKWEDVVNRKHTLESSPMDTHEEFLRELHRGIGSGIKVEIDGKVGVLMVPYPDTQPVFV